MAGKKNWEVKKLGEVCEKTDQGQPKNFFKKEFRYIDISSINAEAKEIQNANLIPVEGAPSRARKIVGAGDIVFATTRPYLENIAIVPTEFNNAIASTGFCVIRANATIAYPEFLYFTVISKPFIKKVLPFQRGANYPAVSDKDIFGIKIPLPPLQIQKQIVAKLSAVQDYKKQLLRQKAKLKELFDSALHKSMNN
jgi:type I restriction enzyme S subunit